MINENNFEDSTKFAKTPEIKDKYFTIYNAFNSRIFL